MAVAKPVAPQHPIERCSRSLKTGLLKFAKTEGSSRRVESFARVSSRRAGTASTRSLKAESSSFKTLAVRCSP